MLESGQIEMLGLCFASKALMLKFDSEHSSGAAQHSLWRQTEPLHSPDALSSVRNVSLAVSHPELFQY